MNLNESRAYGFPLSSGILKVENADFTVTERLPESPSGEGEHVWLTIRKDGQNTAWVARQLARWAGVSPRDVSYAGLKDRHAVTTQTFSIHLPGQPLPSESSIDIEGVTVIQSQRHSRKLKTGQLIGNYFTIRVRQTSLSVDTLNEHWQTLIRSGAPNYFGAQRFGFDGQNIARGIEWLSGKQKTAKPQQSIYLSAVRSYLFNQLLDNRVKEGTWNQLIEGDFVQFTEGKSGFYCELPVAHDHERCALGQLSPSASLPGLARESFDLLDQRESVVLAEHTGLVEALARKKVMRQFRKLRVFPEDARFDVIDGDPVFHFFLPAGSFATTLLSELFDWSNDAEISGLE